MQKRIVTRNGQPANAVRRSGYVTEAMCREHGGFAKALAWLNERAAA